MKLLLLISLLCCAAFAQETFTFSFDVDGTTCVGLAGDNCSEPTLNPTDTSVELVSQADGSSVGSFSKIKNISGIDFKIEVSIEGDGSGYYGIDVVVYEIVASLRIEMPIASFFTYNYGTQLSMPIVFANMSTPYFSGGKFSEADTAQFVIPIVYILPSGTKELPINTLKLSRFR